MTPKLTQDGHRQRLQQRFRDGGPAALADHELLELLLTYAIPRRDVKPLARELINHFSSLGRVLDQDIPSLEALGGVGPRGSTLIALVRALIGRYTEAEQLQPRLSSPGAVARYLSLALGGAPKEHVLLLCLDGANRLLHQQTLSVGTVDQAALYPREVAKTALLHDASAVIVAHNHPSRSLEPSQEDRRITHLLRKALHAVGITLHDHFVITRQGLYSIVLEKRFPLPGPGSPDGELP